MGDAVDIVKFQVFFKQSIYCVTLHPGGNTEASLPQARCNRPFYHSSLVTLERLCVPRNVLPFFVALEDSC